MCLIRPIVDISHKFIKRITKLSMEISGSVPSTHPQATSSSVIVQSNQSAEESVVLSSLSDIHQLHQQHQHQQQQHQQQQQQQSQATVASAAHAKHPPQSSASFLGTPRTSSSIQQASSSSAASSPLLSPPGKTLGRNNNGTMVSTSTPSNEAELQLYRVLQKASLLAYYDTLLEMGGDDVQQLCDAGEDEFLEIMALVGMATKPLHVRRFQKALAEWVNNPAAFQTPLSTSIDSSRVEFSPEPVTQSRSPYSAIATYSPSSITGTASMSTNFSTIGSISSNIGSALGSTSSSSTPSSTIQLTPTLNDEQVARITAAAERAARQWQGKVLENKPKMPKKRSKDKDIEECISMKESDPRRMEGIRKFSAIYGRYDCKRKPEKPLTLHEVCVNEASAQLCKFIPALLTIRSELFPLARQVVKDAGFGHSAGIARLSLGQQSLSTRSMDDEGSQSKRMRLPSDTSADYNKEFHTSAEEMRHNLLAIYQKLGKSFDVGDIAARFSSTRYSRSDYDDGDSRFSFSNSSSPQLQSSNGCDIEVEEDSKAVLSDLTKSPVHEATASTTTGTSVTTSNGSNGSLGVHVLSASGKNIIAVANPALALSPTLVEPLTIKRENITMDE